MRRRTYDAVAVPAVNAPTAPPETPTTPVYACQNLNFGAYLITARFLQYANAELVSGTRNVIFKFYDPDNRGPGLLRFYESGVTELVDPKVLNDVRGFLLGEVKRLTVGVRCDDPK